MKKFVITDIHGHYEEMLNALNDAGYHKNNPDHLLISLGDLFDRGPASDKVFEYVMSIKNKILIRGNHDLMLERLFKSKKPLFDDVYSRNGVIDSVCQITRVNGYLDAFYRLKSMVSVKEYFDCLRWFYEDEYRIYVHSWVPFDDDGYSYKSFRNSKDAAWIDACWCNPFERYEFGYNNNILPDKTIVFGHWSTSYAHHWYEGVGEEMPTKNNINNCCLDIYKNADIVALDGCTYLTNRVNVLVVED